VNPLEATFLSDPSLCCTSVEEIVQAEFDLIYPNPSTGMVTIKNAEANSTLQILDLSGKEVFNQSLYSGTQKVNLSALPSGLYIFKLLEHKGQIRTGRIGLID
jgi:hypothetical protein